ncbi:MAG TPA: non-canonical purine NTP pyrophosphatase [Verrucomicrobiae bacterium]|nr:non-canonical purine NTP pyrophosphatase [Verrucomicrobiae bacterium]
MTTIVIATRNPHKVQEIRAILGDGFRFLTLNDFPAAPKVVEDAHTFAGNATKKAVELAKWLATEHSSSRVQPARPNFVLADDSGLEVDALGGAPGVHSARFAAEDAKTSGNTPDGDNNAKLLRLMKDAENRAARFHCVIALAPVMKSEPENASSVCYADELELETRTFDGTCEGRIISGPRGNNGFGYDPLFVPNGFEQTFAELGDDVKNRLSHRARALEKLKASLLANFQTPKGVGS